MRSTPPNAPPLDASLLKPGLRLAVALSGGADSVALLRLLAERSGELGLALHVAHLHHGLRGAEADGDLDFCRELAAKLGLPFHEARIDTAREAQADPKAGKAAESIEEAARRLRYAWFRQLLAAENLDAVATAHTLADQAETVLAKFLRGAWTEGLSGIHPVLEFAEGKVVRPLLGATRSEIESYLRGLGQDWREDSSNRHLVADGNFGRAERLDGLRRKLHVSKQIDLRYFPEPDFLFKAIAILDLNHFARFPNPETLRVQIQRTEVIARCHQLTNLNSCFLLIVTKK